MGNGKLYRVTLYILREDTLKPLENNDQKNYKNALDPVRNSKRTRNRIVLCPGRAD